MSEITTLIEKHRKLAETEAGVKKTQVAKRFKQTLVTAQGVFEGVVGAGVWEELSALAGRPSAKKDSEGVVTELVYHVEHPDLVPFTLTATALFARSGWHGEPRQLAGYQIAAHQGLNSPVILKDAEMLGAFLARLVEVRAGQDAEKRERRLQELRHTLDNPRVDPAVAEAARDELAGLGGDEVDARRRYDEWRAKYEERLANEEEERSVRQRIASFALALRDWQEAVEAARQARDEQVRFDVPFNAFRMAYGVVGEEDGEQFATTQLAAVLDAEPDEGGWYRRLENHALHAFRPLHPVSITRAITLPRMEGVRVRYEGSGLQLFAAPDRVEEARKALAELVAGLPAAPVAPDPVDFGLEEERRYDTGGWHAWERVGDVREMVLEYGSLPPWVDES